MSSPTPLAEIIGANARRIRLESEVTLDRISLLARSYGLKWSTARVVEMEKGKLPVTASLLVILAHVLGAARNYPVSLPELLEHDGEVLLNEQTLVASNVLLDAFAGGPVVIPTTQEQIEGGKTAMLEWLSKTAPLMPEGMSLGDPKVMKLLDAMEEGLTEKRAAKELGVPTIVLNAHSMHLWGKSLSAERDEVSDEHDSPQARGYKTRMLLVKLRESIAKAAAERTQAEPQERIKVLGVSSGSATHG